MTNKPVDCKKIAELACSKWFSYQNVIELEMAARAVQRFDPKVILEIGVANGASLATWAAVTNAELVIGIDPCVLEQSEKTKKSFDGLVEKYDIKLIKYIDRAPEAHEALEKLLEGRKIDFLFIDGGHGYHDAAYDFQAYRRYLNTPSIIGFHDVYYNDTLADGGSLVNFYWDRVVRNSGYKYDLFHSNSSMGIGIIYFTEENREDLMNDKK